MSKIPKLTHNHSTFLSSSVICCIDDGFLTHSQATEIICRVEAHDTLTKQHDDLLAALKENYVFTKYAAAIKKENTDEYLKEFFRLGESAQKAAKAAIAAGG